jgi:hypothetical protein
MRKRRPQAPAKRLPSWAWHPNGHDRRLTPTGRWHQHWCAVFNGKSCDCDDSRPRDPRIIRRSPSGEVAPRKERELEDA